MTNTGRPGRYLGRLSHGPDHGCQTSVTAGSVRTDSAVTRRDRLPATGLVPGPRTSTKGNDVTLVHQQTFNRTSETSAVHRKEVLHHDHTVHQRGRSGADRPG